MKLLTRHQIADNTTMAILRKLETKIPPPVYGLITAVIMWWLDTQYPALAVIPAALSSSGSIIILAGFSIDLLALRQFFSKGTSANPLSPDKASTIVITGLYRYTRNPMYLGLLIALCGWGIYLGNLASLTCLPFFIWVMTWMQIKPEERILSATFGEPYTDYLKQVRRWL